MPRIDHRRAALWLAAGFAAALVVFGLWPGLDIRFSALFYRPGQGFWLAGDPWLQGLRELVWNLSIAAVLLSALTLILAAVQRSFTATGARRAGFILLLYLLGPILLVNGVLKQHWGRARPVDIAEFGGAREFTPPWLPADQCASNCSFVSGEGSAAVALAITLVLLAPFVRAALPRALFGAYVALGMVLPAAGILLRVATGRHFLSDTVFAALFVLAIALALHRWLLAGRR